MSPERISAMSPPRDWTRPWPSVTYRVCPTAWECHAVRAEGVKWTALTRTREGSSPRAMASIQTSPVNMSAGPLAVGCLGWNSTVFSSITGSCGQAGSGYGAPSRRGSPGQYPDQQGLPRAEAGWLCGWRVHVVLLNGVPARRAGTASGVFSTSRQVEALAVAADAR